jgi:hypothetical protein
MASRFCCCALLEQLLSIGLTSMSIHREPSLPRFPLSASASVVSTAFGAARCVVLGDCVSI